MRDNDWEDAHVSLMIRMRVDINLNSTYTYYGKEKGSQEGKEGKEEGPPIVGKTKNPPFGGFFVYGILRGYLIPLMGVVLSALKW